MTPPPVRLRAGALLRSLLLVPASLGLWACDLLSSSDPGPDSTAPARSSASSAPAVAAPSASSSAATEKPLKSDRSDRTHRAGRCGECHEKMFDEWTASAHAHADDSPVFAAMRKQASEPSCERCHAPLVLLKEPPTFAAREAVSCEVCHRIQSVEVAEPMSHVELLLAHETKLGPRCDPTKPYFHRASCSPLFKKPELCAACHQLFQPPIGGGVLLPVHTEYSDFQKTQYAAKGKSCQDCHMPGVRAELAIGERERDGVPDHGFLGDAGKLRGSALTAVASASWKAGWAEVSVSVTNARAGHAIPAGSPGREVLIRVSAHDQNGVELERQERVFGRRLVDADGRAAPFYLASRVGSDTRLMPRKTRRDVLTFDKEGVRELRLTLAFRALEPELSRRLGMPESEPSLIAESSIAFGSSKPGSRSIVLKR